MSTICCSVHPKPKITVRWIFRLGSFWMGAHWSDINRRWCINLVPCITICVVLPGGVIPEGNKK